MRKSRFTESQDRGHLERGRGGGPARRPGCASTASSRGSYFNWRSKYAGTSVSELKRMKELELGIHPKNQSGEAHTNR